MAEPVAVAGQPGVLRLGRAGLYPYHVPLHRHRLHPRNAGGEVQAQGQRPGGPVGGGLVGHLQSGSAVLFQVLGLRCRQPPSHRFFLHAEAGPEPAHRHLLLHLPDHELHHRRVPGRRQGAAQPRQLRHLRHTLPPAHRRSHHQIQRSGRPDRPPHPLPRAVCLRRADLRGGPGEKGPAGQQHRQAVGYHSGPPRQGAHHCWGMAGRGRFRFPALLRLLRLLRHGCGPGPDAGLRVHAQLQLPLYRQVGHRVLAAVAHLPRHLVPGVPLYPPGRQPGEQAPAVFQPSGGVGGHRHLARGELELPHLGTLLRRPADFWKRLSWASSSRSLPPPSSTYTPCFWYW